jgi:hypothetical protein
MYDHPLTCLAGEDEDTIPSSQGEDETALIHTPGKRMRLCRVGSERVELFHWEESVRMDAQNSQPFIHFVLKE